jgi:hypothetical protein
MSLAGNEDRCFSHWLKCRKKPANTRERVVRAFFFSFDLFWRSGITKKSCLTRNTYTR